ncbi:MAG: histidine kinase dimerization/phospho-acceptor domain-containing protein, partial [Planctomycetota bacterium]
MSVSTKLWAGFAVTVLLGAVLVYDLSVIRDLASANRRLATISSRVGVVGTEQVFRLDRLRDSAAKYRVTSDPGYAEQFLLLAEDIRFSFESLDTLSLTPGERAHLERIEGLSDRFGPVTRRFGTALEQDRSRVYGPWAAQAGLEDWILELREETVLLTEASRAAMLEEAAASSRRAQTAERGAWLLAGFVLLFGAAATAAVARSLSSEVRRLAAGTRKVAEGDFEHRLTGAQEREFRQLESDFNLMIERLGEAEALKKDFVAAVSHDLKSPLASIQETLGLLLEEIPGPVTERQRRLLALAGKSGERLSTMISKLLELAQMEARVLRYDVRTVDLVPVVREVVEEAEP